MKPVEPFTIDLVGISFDPDSEEQDWFVALNLDQMEAQDEPLTSEGYILLLPRIDCLPKALSLAGIAPSSVASLPTEEAMTVNVSQVMYLLLEETVDDQCTILNFLNTFFDLVRATPFVFPEDYKAALFRMANHLTFEKEFGTFFDEQTPRSLVINGVAWLVGAVFSNTKFVR